LIEEKDEATQLHVLLSLTFLSEEARDNNIKSIIDNSLVSKVLKYIGAKDDRLVVNALKVIGNIARGSKELTHVKLKQNILLKK